MDLLGQWDQLETKDNKEMQEVKVQPDILEEEVHLVDLEDLEQKENL